VKQATKNKSAAKNTVADVRDDEKPNINNESLMISLGDAAQMLGIHRTTAWAIHDAAIFRCRSSRSAVTGVSYVRISITSLTPEKG